MSSTCNESSQLELSFTHAARPRRVLELFAGVGGFRHGLEQADQHRANQGLPRAFETVWANQWEPGCVKQHAAKIYEARWGEAPVNRNIFEVLEDPTEMDRIDALDPDTLVGGFPCQDYSVARPASQSAGLEGKKGVLWWGIHRLLQQRLAAGQPIQTLLLENVDRLIKSPSPCRGRDFAIILSSLQDLGYAIAWQVVNAADYGYPQRRKRVFITAVHESAPEYQAWMPARTGAADADAYAWLTAASPSAASPLALALPVRAHGALTRFALGADVHETQADYRPVKGGRNARSRFASSGLCIGGQVWTLPIKAASYSDYTAFVGQTKRMTLGDVVRGTTDVPETHFLDEASLESWRHFKGGKKVERVTADGFAYTYSEGAMAFPDPLDKPSRTIITAEGGASASRTTHVVRHSDGRLRRLTPEELEVLNGFPRGFTAMPGTSDVRRGFLMGNALVTGIVARIGQAMAAQRDCAQPPA